MPQGDSMKHVLLLTLLASFGAYAQSSASISANTSSTNLSQNVLEKIKPDRISHFSIISGPSVDGNSERNDAQGNEDGVDCFR